MFRKIIGKNFLTLFNLYFQGLCKNTFLQVVWLSPLVKAQRVQAKLVQIAIIEFMQKNLFFCINAIIGCLN
jgi:hypothetical protein